MKKITKKDAWKNFDIRFEFKEKKDDIQLLVYLDNELAFATRKDAFVRKEITCQKIKLNKWHLPQFYQYKKSVLAWRNTDEKGRYIRFCKKFKLGTCDYLQRELDKKLSFYM
jgi:hypothetical protein